MKPIPMSAPDIDESDVAAVTAVLRSGQLARGPKAEEFERAVAGYVGVPHAVAVSSGTAALHLLIRALGIGAGDEVIVPSYTFCATVNALLYEGAVPVFADVDSETGNIDTGDIEHRITPRTRAVMVVDAFGYPADWEGIERVARDHWLEIIDDACEAIGAEYNGRRIGSFGDGAAFAFYPNKQITTGEGGMIVTANPRVAKLARSMRNHGRAETGFDPERLGFSYSMNEMSAALGCSQMRRIDVLLAKREAVARLYTEYLQSLSPSVRAPRVRPGVKASWFVYVVTLADGLRREPVMRAMEAHGIPVRGYFSPMHLAPYIRQRFANCAPGSLPRTESLAARTFALPFHGNMTAAEVDRVVSVLADVLETEASQ